MSQPGTGSRIPAAVVGVGRMGQHHARNYAQLEGFALVAVVDSNRAAAEKAAAQYHCRAFSSVQELLASGVAVQAATVATPTVYHRPIAEVLLPAGVDVLIEKPLAPSVTDGRVIVDLARNHGRVLQVGHTERFNPAFVALKGYGVNPRYVEVHRISPMTFRSIDVGVVLDMMIHDIDIVQSLVRAPVKEVQAVGVTVVGDHEDIANARIVYANGCVASMTASRLALKTERKMRLFSPNAYVTVDYAKKSGAIITRTANEEQLEKVREQIARGELAELTQLDYTKVVKYEDLPVVDKEPLRAELENFLQAIRTRGRPEVTGEDGLAAVDTAARIAQCIREHVWDGVTPSSVPYPPTNGHNGHK